MTSHPTIDTDCIPQLKAVLRNYTGSNCNASNHPWLISHLCSNTVEKIDVAVIDQLINQEASEMNREFAIANLKKKRQLLAQLVGKQIIVAGCWRRGELHLLTIDGVTLQLLDACHSKSPRPLGATPLEVDT